METMEIYTADDLRAFRDRVNSNFETYLNAVLMADIDLTETDENGKRISWAPIGSGYKSKTIERDEDDDHYVTWEEIEEADANMEFFPFRGVFDGQGHNIHGLYVIRYQDFEGWNDVGPNEYLGDISRHQPYNMAGLFGMNKGVIKNLTVHGSVENYNGEVAGAISGINFGAGIIENCHNLCTVEGRGFTGGIVGSNAGSAVIRDCTNAGQITGSGKWAGGIFGFLEVAKKQKQALISNCINTGTIYINGKSAADNLDNNQIGISDTSIPAYLIQGNQQSGKVVSLNNSLAGMRLRYAYFDVNGYNTHKFKETLSQDPDNKYVNSIGQTYLHLICARKPVPPVKLIHLLAVETDIDFNAKDNDGKTASDYLKDTPAAKEVVEFIEAVAKDKVRLDEEPNEEIDGFGF